MEVEERESYVVEHVFAVSRWETEASTWLDDRSRREANHDHSDSTFEALTTERSETDTNSAENLSTALLTTKNYEPLITSRPIKVFLLIT